MRKHFKHFTMSLYLLYQYVAKYWCQSLVQSLTENICIFRFLLKKFHLSKIVPIDYVEFILLFSVRASRACHAHFKRRGRETRYFKLLPVSGRVYQVFLVWFCGELLKTKIANNIYLRYQSMTVKNKIE